MRRNWTIILFACQSFAWFTSKDEVTNRLTASADYGVSIIENFAPPKQWTPGQTVTKEEAVTNTGNVDAFVKQKITADLEVTVEVPAATAPTTTDATGYIKLEPAEYGAIEAGSYVAWSPVASEIGRKVVFAMDTTGELGEDGHVTTDQTDFTPSTTGLYIFRRAITTTAITTTENNDKLKDTAYDYVGYYVVKDGSTVTYYKLNTIDANTLELAASGNGDLAKAPTVMFSKEETKTIKNVPMVYDSTAAPKLTVTYQTDRHSDNNDLSNADRAAYDAYDTYLDKLKGATKWDSDRNASGVGAYSDTGAYDTTTVTYAKDIGNHTGLINYDEYYDTPVVNADTTTYENFSYERLEARATETAAELTAASPASWGTEYNQAVAERKKVNKGVRSAERLAALKTEVLTTLGTTLNAADGGLKQDTSNYPFHYSSDTYNAETGAVTAPSVTLKNHTAYLGNSDETSNGNVRFLTLDNMIDPIFADANVGNSTSSKAVFVTAPDYGAKFAYTSLGSTSELKQKWDAYVLATQRKALVTAKKTLVSQAKTATTTSTTNVGRTAEELDEWMTALESEERVIDAALTTAKSEYEALITGDNGIKSKIDKMNEYQDDINAANEVTGTNYGADKAAVPTDPEASDYDSAMAAAVATYPNETTGRGRSMVKGDGAADTGEEDELETYLLQAYGVAYKDAIPQNDYTGAVDGEDLEHCAADDLYKDIPTYSQTVTQKAIDGNVTEDFVHNGSTDEDEYNGKIRMKTAAECAASDPAVTQITNNSEITAIQASPYYEDLKVNMMKDRRAVEVQDALDDYNDKKAAAVAYADLDVNATQPIVINVNLANIGDGTANDEWQYIEGATGNANKEFNFYYTSILGSGETSKLLIKSVDMGNNVDQNSFRNLKFDLNVGAESAQVVFDGDYALATAANETLSGANTTQDKYTSRGPVAWTKDSTATPPTYENPQGKATANVT